MHENSIAPNFPAPSGDTMLVRKTSDFVITGEGDNSAWNKVQWQELTTIAPGGVDYATKSKMLYSEKGIYLFFTGEDRLVSTKEYKDGEEIYEGDVYEFFVQTDPDKPPYFEYEINPLGKQLVLMLARFPKKNLAWSPWHHEYDRDPLIQRKVVVNRSNNNSAVVPQVGESIKSWSAELFFPYELLGLLPDIPPKTGAVWQANFCRIDYDGSKVTEWSWSKEIKTSFHELEHFGTIIFE